MSKYITERIETITNQRERAVVDLKLLFEFLQKIRGIDSIRREFEEGFVEIENRRGDIYPDIKKSVFEYIDQKAKNSSY